MKIQPRSVENAGFDSDYATTAFTLVNAASRGSVPLAGAAFPWPPPAYIWQSRTAAKTILSTSNLLRDRHPLQILTLGDATLDQQLKGVFLCGTIIEVTGRAGSGKTQLALTLAAETVFCSERDVMSKCCTSSHPDICKRSQRAARSEYNEECFSRHSNLTSVSLTRECCTDGAESQNSLTAGRSEYSRTISNPGLTREKSKTSEPDEPQCDCWKPAVVYYLHTEGSFPVQRLQEILATRCEYFNSLVSDEAEVVLRTKASGGLSQAAYCTGEAKCQRDFPGEGKKHQPSARGNSRVKNLMQRIIMEEIITEEQLWTSLTRRLPCLFLSYKVKLVVIDSIAAVFRMALGSLRMEPDCAPVKDICTFQKNATGSGQSKADSGMVDRTAKLMRIGALLRRVVKEHLLCCVIINQVSDIVSEVPTENHRNYMESESKMNSDAFFNSRRVCKLDNQGIMSVFRWSNPSSGMDGTYAWDVRNVHGPPVLFAGREVGTVHPALGLSWSNCVNTRLMLHKLVSNIFPRSFGDTVSGMEKKSGSLRCLRILFGNTLCNAKDIYFKVDKEGIVNAFPS